MSAHRVGRWVRATGEPTAHWWQIRREKRVWQDLGTTERFDCPCGTSAEPELKWVRAVENPYQYNPAHYEVICRRCGFYADVYPKGVNA